MAIAIDHQPRIGLRQEHGLQPVGHRPSKALHADIARDVPGPVGRPYSQVAQRLGKKRPGVVADQQKWA